MLGHSLAYLLARGLPGLLSFAALALFTRLLSPTEYGTYALAMSVAGLLAAVLFRWLDHALVRYHGMLPSAGGFPAPGEARLMRALFAGFLLMWPVAFLALGGALWLLPTQAPGLWLAAAGAMLGLALYDLNLQWSVARMQPAAYGALGFARALLTLGLGGAFALLGFGGEGLVWAAALGFLLPSLLLRGREIWRCLRVRESPQAGLPARGLLLSMMRYGAPLALSFALTAVVTQSDRLMLGALVGVEATGRYVAGYDLAFQAMNLVAMVVFLAAWPRVVRAWEAGGEAAACGVMSAQYLLLLGGLLPLCAGFALMSAWLAGVMLGEEFRDSAVALMPWAALAGLLAGFKTFYFDMAFQLVQRTRGLLGVAALAAGGNVLLNLWWIPRMGEMGAVLSSVAAYALALVASLILGRAHLRMPLPGRGTAFIVLAVLAQLAVLGLWPGERGAMIPGALAVLGAGSVYLIVLLLFDVGGLRGALAGRWREGRRHG
ncbi:MAG: oligosaccharide flippase family protein [Pseudomonadota bacterium]